MNGESEYELYDDSIDVPSCNKVINDFCGHLRAPSREDVGLHSPQNNMALEKMSFQTKQSYNCPFSGAMLRFRECKYSGNQIAKSPAKMYIVRIGLGLGNSCEMGEPLNLDFTTPGS